jgi:TonB family protein
MIVAIILAPGCISGQVHLSGEQADKLIVEKPEAAYPPLAKQMRLQGAVKADVTVSEAGAVSSTKLISGHPLLVTAALDAVKKYRYKPYLIDGRAAPFITTFEVLFSVGIPKKEYDEEQSVNERYFKEGDKCCALLKEQKTVEAEEVCKAAVPIADQLPEGQGLTKMLAYESQQIQNSGGLSVTQNHSSCDGVNRLVTATEAGGSSEWTQTFGYDRWGNRIVSSGYTPNADQTPSDLTKFSGNRWTRGAGDAYDNAGNQVSVASKASPGVASSTFQFDAENRMTQSNVANMGNVNTAMTAWGAG